MTLSRSCVVEVGGCDFIRFQSTRGFAAFLLFVFGMYLLLCGYSPAFAQSIPVPTTTPSATAKVLCDVLAMILLDIGRGIATLAVVALGVGAMMGKASLGQGVVILVGIGVIFGAPDLAYTMTKSPALLNMALVCPPPVTSVTR